MKSSNLERRNGIMKMHAWFGPCSRIGIIVVLAFAGCGPSEHGEKLMQCWSTVGSRDVAGIVLPIQSKGFDYCLGKYRIGSRETDFPKFNEKCSIASWRGKAESWMNEATVWLPDGYINRILITSKSGSHADAMKYSRQRINEYSTKYGFKFKETAKSKPEEPIYSAGVVDDISIVIAVLKSSDVSGGYYWCISLDATDYISKCVKSGEGCSCGIKDLWLGGESIGRKCVNNAWRWSIRKLAKPIRHFQQLVVTDQDGYIDTITLRGKVNKKEGGWYPAADPETQEIIRNELDALKEMYSKKYGLEFKCESISDFWKLPTYVANIDEERFPGVVLKIECPPKLSDDGVEFYHVSVLLDAHDYVSCYVDWVTKTRASKNTLPQNDGEDAL